MNVVVFLGVLSSNVCSCIIRIPIVCECLYVLSLTQVSLKDICVECAKSYLPIAPFMFIQVLSNQNFFSQLILTYGTS